MFHSLHCMMYHRYDYMHDINSKNKIAIIKNMSLMLITILIEILSFH